MSYFGKSVPVELEWDSNFKGMNVIVLTHGKSKVHIGLDEEQSDKVFGLIEKIFEENHETFVQGGDPKTVDY